MTFSVETAEAALSRPPTAPLAGQQTIPVATIDDHVYEGQEACTADWFGTPCGQHRDAHHHTKDRKS